MASHEHPKSAIERLADRDLIDTVIKLQEIPVNANNLEDLQVILNRTGAIEALSLLALSALSDEVPDDRFSGPSVFVGGSRYFREFDKSPTEEVPPSEFKGSMVALAGLHAVTQGTKTFQPKTLRAHSNDGLMLNLEFGLDGKNVRALYDDKEPPLPDELNLFAPIDSQGAAYSYTSLYPPGRVEAKGPSRRLGFENDPSTVLLAIRGIAGKLYEAHVAVELTKTAAIAKSVEEKVSA